MTEHGKHTQHTHEDEHQKPTPKPTQTPVQPAKEHPLGEGSVPDAKEPDPMEHLKDL